MNPKKAILLVLFCFPFFIHAQQITNGEYFFDTDPGVGNGTALPLFSQSDSVIQTINIHTPGLNPGFHRVYFRYKNITDGWGITEDRLFYVYDTIYPMATNQTPIAIGEYFIDTDPGMGNGVSIPAFSSTDSAIQNINISAAGLNVGFHRAYFRYKNNSNGWGIPEDRLFYIYDTVHSIASNQSAITKVEYFIDTDPGIGNGVSMLAFSSTDSAIQNINISTLGLSVGFHRVYFRYKNNSNEWGIPEDRLLYIYDVTHPIASNQPPITKGEYFFDTDPGVGNGSLIPAFTSSDSVINDMMITTSGISAGSHYINLRYMNAQREWGIAETRIFSVCNSLPNTPIINGNSAINVCDSSSVSISATPASGASIFWRGPNGFTSTNNVINIANVNVSKVGTYKAYSVTGATNCDTSMAASVVLSNNSQLHLKALLQGLFIGNGTMASAPFNADGISPTTIADTISLNLHNPSDYSIAYSFKTTISTDGNAFVRLPTITNGNNYYIVVNHRNSISTWSTNSLNFGCNTNYDFTSAVSQASGSNLVNDGTGKYLIYTGDINQDSAVDFNDYPSLDIESSNGAIGYLASDLNGDASVDFNDYPMIDLNSSNGVIMITP